LNSTIQLNGKTVFTINGLKKGILFIEDIFGYRSNVFAHLQWLYDLSDTEYLNYITLAVY